MPGHTISGMSKVNTKAIDYHFRISKIVYYSEKITILPNFRSISFIGNGSLFFITQYWQILCDEGDGLVAVKSTEEFRISFSQKHSQKIFVKLTK